MRLFEHRGLAELSIGKQDGEADVVGLCDMIPVCIHLLSWPLNV